jgi:hypothetical protein
MGISSIPFEGPGSLTGKTLSTGRRLTIDPADDTRQRNLARSDGRLMTVEHVMFYF